MMHARVCHAVTAVPRLGIMLRLALQQATAPRVFSRTCQLLGSWLYHIYAPRLLFPTENHTGTSPGVCVCNPYVEIAYRFFF